MARLTPAQLEWLRRLHEEGPILLPAESEARADADHLVASGLARFLDGGSLGRCFVLSGQGVREMQRTWIQSPAAR